MEPDDLEIFASLRSNQINPFNRPNIFNISGGGITTTPSAAMFLDDAGLPPIDTSYGSANEPDDEEDIERAKRISNRKGLGLLSLLNPFALLGPVGSFIGGGIRGGLQGLQNFNQGLRGTDFGQSKTLAEYFQKRRDRKARELAAKRGADKQRIQDLKNFNKNFKGYFSGNIGGSGQPTGGGNISGGISRGGTDDTPGTPF